MSSISHNRAVVSALLASMTLTEHTHFVNASGFLLSQLQHSMVNTALYGIPIDREFPPGVPWENLHQYVSPYNIAVAALIATYSANNFGALPPDIPPNIMVYAGNWIPLTQVMCDPMYELIYRPKSPEPAPPPAPPPPMNPADAYAAAMAVLSGGTGSPAPASPVELAQMSPTVPPEATATETPVQAPVPVAASPAPTLAEARIDVAFAYHQSPHLPAVDVMAAREGGKGRPAKSAFEKGYQKRETFGKPPYWWAEFRKVWLKLLRATPPNAANTDSTAPTTVMAYGLALAMLREVLLDVNPDLPVGDLLLWLNEVDRRVTASPAGPVVYDLFDNLFAEQPEQNSTT